MSNSSTLEIFSIALASWGKDLAGFFTRQPEGYLKYFHPFTFDVETLERELGDSKKDIYQCLFHSNTIVGFSMLRGFDEGFEIPTIGIVVDSLFRRQGFGHIMVTALSAVAHLRDCEKVMAKVHLENFPSSIFFIREGFNIREIADDTVYLLKDTAYGKRAGNRSNHTSRFRNLSHSGN